MKKVLISIFAIVLLWVVTVFVCYTYYSRAVNYTSIASLQYRMAKATTMLNKEMSINYELEAKESKLTAENAKVFADKLYKIISFNHLLKI